MKRPIRYAVVGLGHIAQAAVLPAFGHATRNSKLVALVSDDATKRKRLGRRYGATLVSDYSGLPGLLSSGAIDAVYIATPNSEHLRFVRVAAKAGVHVLCEKPLGVTERECREAIEACRRGGVRLMTAYRLHFEVANLKALSTIRAGQIGEPRMFMSTFSYQIKDRTNIRLKAGLGGGPLHDIGIYCINAARTLFQAEPIEVQGWEIKSQDPRFRQVEEGVSAQMRFSTGAVATMTCSFGAATTGWYQVVGTHGDVRADPAFEYAEGLRLSVTVNEKTRTTQFAKRDQFAAELSYFSNCIAQRKDPEPSGQEGLADVRVIDAILRSMRTNRPVKVLQARPIAHPNPRQRIDRPAVRREPKLVRARSASE